MRPKWLKKLLFWYLKLSFLVIKQYNRHFHRLSLELMAGSKENLSPTLFDFTLHFPMYLSDEHTAYHSFKSTLAKAWVNFSWKFSNTITFWFQIALLCCFDIFSWCFKNFLWHSANVLSIGSSTDETILEVGVTWN